MTETAERAMAYAHPGALVADAIAEAGLTVAQAATGLGVTRQQLYRIANGTSAISPEMALRLEAGFGGKASVWLRMQAEHDLERLRRAGAVPPVKRLTKDTEPA